MYVSLSADLDISVNVRGIVGTYLLRTYTVGTAVDLANNSNALQCALTVGAQSVSNSSSGASHWKAKVASSLPSSILEPMVLDSSSSY
jgi:hypothetical protein